jgi:hypothetical protein
MFCNTVSSVEHIRAGRLRALAVTTATRSDALPDLPTVGEFVQGYETSGWYGVGAPKNTPAEIVEKLNREINAGLASRRCFPEEENDLAANNFPIDLVENKFEMEFSRFSFFDFGIFEILIFANLTFCVLRRQACPRRGRVANWHQKCLCDLCATLARKASQTCAYVPFTPKLHAVDVRSF